MIFVALGLAAGWAVSVSVLTHLLRSVLRAHARREDLLVNQILHLTGNTWQEPPRERVEEEEPEYELVDPDQAVFV